MSCLLTRCLLLAAALLGATALANAAALVPLRMIGINDFHGNLESTGLTLTLADPQAAGPGSKPLRIPVGGAAALAGLVSSLRAGMPHSVLLSAGDLIGAAPLVSTLFRHESTIEVMNAIGLELGAVGNHEFDAGITELHRLATGGCAQTQPDASATSCSEGPYRGARFPMLAANVVDTNGRPLLAPYVVKRYGGVQVGFIGAVTKSTPRIVVPSGVEGLSFTDEAQAVNRAARRLRSQGVTAIVAIFHEGGELGTPQQRGDWNDTRCADAHGPIFDIARRLVPDIKVVFTGHTHQGYRCILDGRVIIQGTSYGRGVSVVDVLLDPVSGQIVTDSVRSINLPVVNDDTAATLREKLAAALPQPYAEVLRSTRPDPAIARLVAHYAGLVAPRAQRLIGTIGGSFSRAGVADSAAGRLIADAQLAATRSRETGAAQIALMNPGGIRSNLECAGVPPCAVTFGQVFTMQPFGNSIVVMTLTGAQIKELLESQQRRGTGELTLLQPSSGFSYTWKSDAPPGDRAQDIALNREPLASTGSYRIAVNSFLAEGGDGFVVLRQGTDRIGGGQDIDALLDYLKAPALQSPSVQVRINRLP
jgi:5'-nucleotidase